MRIAKTGWAFLLIAAVLSGCKPAERTYDNDAMGAGGAGQDDNSGGTSFSASMSSTSSSSTSGGVDITVSCANEPCAPGEVCCMHPHKRTLDECGLSGSCDADSVTISCNGPADCPGHICCGTQSASSYSDISCQPTCSGQGQVTLCDDDSNACPTNTKCERSYTLGEGYWVCR